MKKNTTIVNIVALSVLFTTSAITAQTDSVRVRTTTTETVTSGTRPTPVPAEVPAATVAPTPAPATVAPAPAPSPAATATDDNHDDAPLSKGEFGVRYYPTFSALRVRTYNGETVEGALTMTHGFGVFLGHNFNHHVGLIFEVDYNQFSQRYKDRNLDREVNLAYLNIPVLLSLNTDKANWVNWNFVVGPQFGLNIGSSFTEAPGDTVRATVAARGFDVGLAYGTGLEFSLNHDHTFRLDVGYRGFLGLVDMSANQSSSSPDTYNLLLSAKRKYHAPYIGLALMF